MRLILLVTLGLFALSAYSFAELEEELEDDCFDVECFDELAEDIDDFLDLIPKADIFKIITYYVANDDEVQKISKYIKSEAFKRLILDIEAIPEYKQVLKYLDVNGLDVYYYINTLHYYLGLPKFVPQLPSYNKLQGIRAMIDEILPSDKFKKLFYEKLETSPDFSDFIESIRGDEFKNILQQLLANEEFQILIQKAKDNGVDFNSILEILRKNFGWDFSQ